MTLSDDILKDIANDIRDSIVHEIEADHLVYSGQLKNSWQIKKNEDGSISIGSTLIWALVHDQGRLPGTFPPVNKLFPWVRDKIGGSNQQAIRQKAFLIARKIASEGISPKHFVKRALYRIGARPA